MRIAAAIELSPEQRTSLERMARQRSLPSRLVERARIVLLPADGLENQQIAQRLRMTPEKVARWRSRSRPMRLQPMGAPDAPYAGLADTRGDLTINFYGAQTCAPSHDSSLTGQSP